MYRRNNYIDTVYRLNREQSNATKVKLSVWGDFYYLSDSFYTAIDLANDGKLKEIESITGYHEVKSIFIPNGVTKIGSLHGLPLLPGLSFPGTLKELGSISFCNQLKSLYFCGEVERCGSIGCVNLTNLQLGSMRRLEQLHGGKLSSLKIPDSMTYLGGIHDSTCLRSLHLGTSLKHIGSISGNMISFLIPSTVTHLGLLSSPELTSLIIPSSVQIFNGLYGCDRLNSIVIPNSITCFGSIRNCYSLTSITIGKRIQNFRKETIYECSPLLKIQSPNPIQGEIRISQQLHLENHEMNERLKELEEIYNIGCVGKDQRQTHETKYELIDEIYLMIFNEMITTRVQSEKVVGILQDLERCRMFYDD